MAEAGSVCDYVTSAGAGVSAVASGTEEADVIVVGAGAAGIAAARELGAGGRRVIVLEGRGRVGGRAFTANVGDGVCPVDMGGQWLHQCGDENPVYHIAKAAGVRFVRPCEELPPDMADAHSRSRRWQVFDTVEGGPVSQEMLDDASDAISRGVRTSRRVAGEARRRGLKDSPLSQVVLQSAPELASEDDGGDALWRRMLGFQCVVREQLEAADFADLSLQLWDEGGELSGGDRSLPDGYGTLITSLATGLDVRFEHVVTDVVQDGEGVTVTATVGDAVHTFAAPYAVITLPVGVLKCDAVRFSPPLAATRRAAIARLGPGAANKLAVRFEKHWWPKSASALGLLYDTVHDGYKEAAEDTPAFPWVFDNTLSCGQPVLLAFTNGRRAVAMEALTDEELVALFVKDLRGVFGEGVVPAPVAHAVSRWASDPMSRGSWTSFPPGCGGVADMDAVAGFDGRLVFAGEHTFGAAQGTVHGAFMSGQVAARGLLSPPA